MNELVLANSADYADALLTARKARSVLILVILLSLLFQLGLFFAARYKLQIDDSSVALDFLKYLVGLTDFSRRCFVDRSGNRSIAHRPCHAARPATRGFAPGVGLHRMPGADGSFSSRGRRS